MLSSVDISSYCPVEIVKNRQDQLIYHSINSFILVTWGTEIVEECLKPVHKRLTPGTYLIEWDEKCSLCTVDHCIQGTVITGSSLWLNSTWQALKVPALRKFSELKLANSLTLPSQLSTIKDLKLRDLTLEEPASIVWSNGDTSFVINLVIISVVVLIIISGLVYALLVRKGRVRNKGSRREPKCQSKETTPGLDLAEVGMPLMETPLQARLARQGITIPPLCVKLPGETSSMTDSV